MLTSGSATRTASRAPASRAAPPQRPSILVAQLQHFLPTLDLHRRCDNSVRRLIPLHLDDVSGFRIEVLFHQVAHRPEIHLHRLTLIVDFQERHSATALDLNVPDGAMQVDGGLRRHRRLLRMRERTGNRRCQYQKSRFHVSLHPNGCNLHAKRDAACVAGSLATTAQLLRGAASKCAVHAARKRTLSVQSVHPATFWRWAPALHIFGAKSEGGQLMKRFVLSAAAAILLLAPMTPVFAQGRGCGRCGQCGQRQGLRVGSRNGTGPRAQNGTCPRIAQNQQAPAQQTPGQNAPAKK
jgi:hypothetical protein